jgi:hypothetical protein
MWTAPPDPIGFLDSKRFTATLVWLLTFGICYLADVGERVAIPTALTLYFWSAFGNPNSQGSPGVGAARRLVRDPKYFWSRAEEARTMAGRMNHFECKRMMESVAETYERLAKRAAERTRQSTTGQGHAPEIPKL